MKGRSYASYNVSKGLLLCTGSILFIACSAEEATTPDFPEDAEATARIKDGANPTLRRLSYQGQTFLVPKEQILSQRSGKDGEFFRLRLPGSSADIVLDSFNAGKRDNADSPVVFSVNDGPYAGITRFDRSGGAVVCRTGMAAQSGCGTKFDFASAEVTLLFPVGKRDDVDALIEKATEALVRFSVQASSRTESDNDAVRSNSGKAD
ncbi:MAG: hypothetical protein ACK4IB_01220 [Erythrobacter sp.]